MRAAMDLTLRTAPSLDPASDQPVPARERTVTLLFIDIEGSTRLGIGAAIAVPCDRVRGPRFPIPERTG